VIDEITDDIGEEAAEMVSLDEIVPEPVEVAEVTQPQLAGLESPAEAPLTTSSGARQRRPRRAAALEVAAEANAEMPATAHEPDAGAVTSAEAAPAVAAEPAAPEAAQATVSAETAAAPVVAEATAMPAEEPPAPARRRTRAAPKVEIPVDPDLEQVETAADIAAAAAAVADTPAPAPAARKPRPRRAPVAKAEQETLEQVETRSGE